MVRVNTNDTPPERRDEHPLWLRKPQGCTELLPPTACLFPQLPALVTVTWRGSGARRPRRRLAGGGSAGFDGKELAGLIALSLAAAVRSGGALRGGGRNWPRWTPAPGFARFYLKVEGSKWGSLGRLGRREARWAFPWDIRCRLPRLPLPAPPPPAEWPTRSAAAAASRAPARLSADPVSPPDPLVSRCSGWDGSGVLETPFCPRRGVGSPAFFWRFEAGVVVRCLGWAEHRSFGPPPRPSEGSEGPAVSHRFAWVLPLPSFAELCAEAPRVGEIGRDRKLSVSYCSAQACGRGLCAA